MSRRRREPKELSSECLPDEVVYDILTLLPVKSLIRFSDRTLTEISRFEIPFSDAAIVDFCNGMFCLHNYEDDILYLWNPRIRKFKMVLATPHFTDLSSARVAYGFGYHSQNNDFKILRIVVLESKVPPVAEAEVYTLSTDSWRRVVISLESEPNIGYIDLIDVPVVSPFLLFVNGALHSIAFSGDYKFILSFDVNDETFRPIMLPQNYLDGMISQSYIIWLCSRDHWLCLFGGIDPVTSRFIGHIWMMREYGVVESWTKISLPKDFFGQFIGCTDSGELLILTSNKGLVSYDPESLNENYLGIQNSFWFRYTADLKESLVLLDQGQGQDQDPNILLPTWSVPMYRPDGSVAEIPIPRCTNMRRYPTRHATVKDLQEMLVMVESLKLEVTRLSRDLYVGPQEGAFDTGDSEATTLVSSSIRRREH
uniref:F-box associated beta-propeller type 1 domain-containing protein n=1 Tax=Fagus sylvatica TaxID=28930 RepID=A0A2N9IZI4_FAGSY